MKKWLAILSVAAMLVSLAAAATSEVITEEPTVDEATRPEEGRVKEMKDFYVYTPKDWCQLTYKQDSKRLELYDTPSAPDIEKTTPMVRIQLDAEEATKDTLDANVKALLLKDSAKQGKNKLLGGYSFKFLSYKDTDKKTYFVYMGLVDDHICTITLRGISPKDEDVTAILKSLSFK